MDSGEAPPVSQDFNRRLYRRIEQEVSVWDMLARPFRPLFVRRGLPVAAAACLLVMAGGRCGQPPRSPAPKKDKAAGGTGPPDEGEQDPEGVGRMEGVRHPATRD